MSVCSVEDEGLLPSTRYPAIAGQLPWLLMPGASQLPWLPISGDSHLPWLPMSGDRQLPWFPIPGSYQFISYHGYKYQMIVSVTMVTEHC